MNAEGRRILRTAGLSEREEHVYLAMLDHGMASIQELAGALRLPLSAVRSALHSLDEKGLINRTAGEALRFAPLPPAVALDALLRRQQEELDRTRVVVRALEDRFREAAKSSSPEDLVGVVVSREAIADRFLQLQQGATEEVLGFDRPPYVLPGRENPIEMDTMARGIRYRVVYDQTALAEPGILSRIDEFIRAGEEARTFKGVPMKLVIADRRLALIPLNIADPERVGALLIHSSTLLDALTALWETLWRLSVPFPVGRIGDEEDARRGGEGVMPSAGDHRILSLLVAGLKPQAIARQLGMGSSTVERRINRMMDVLGASTRFQAGVLAVQRGWVEPFEPAVPP